ncbi:MAG: transglycosylase domain-containing protein [Crocinitomicaceae bacterium]|nr:transglycosylase domain-containing protein [Crocinitomicaceae bacterium]
MNQKKTSGDRKYRKRLWWLAMFPWILLVLIITAALLSGLPNAEALANPKINLATEIVSSDGKQLGAFYKENRSDVKYDELPQHLVDALIATEDARFRSHSGVDFWSLFRAVGSLGRDGGGSTITQQLAKLQFTTNYDKVNIGKRVWQKLREWIMACRLERLYTKDEIIAFYFNQYDFLNQAVGIKSAAHIYFNTTTKELNKEQSAMLVGMLKNSSLFNPLKRDSLVTKRREVVLNQMVKYHFLSDAEYDSLRVLPLGLDFQRVSHDEGLAPYFREVLRAKLDEILSEKDNKGNLVYAKSDGEPYDLYRDGLVVYTTIDSRLQAYAEWAVDEHLKKELQPAFTKDVNRRKKDKYPFFNGIADADKNRIMEEAIHRSERYQICTGKICPECKRPAYYIKKEKQDGKEVFHCDENKGGCGEHWPAFSEKEIDHIFSTPVKMKVYSHQGYKDTLLSPLDSIKYHKAILHASLMSIEPSTGHIKAWVGGVDFKYFKFDNVYQSRRQVGSTFKPLVYATALRLGKRPCDKYFNLKTCIDLPTGGKWCPDNSDGSYGGEYSLNYALANSVNTITAALIKDFGPESVITLAKNLGIKSKLPAVPAIALGVAELSLYEMAGANAAFVNNGVYIEPTYIIRIEDKNGNTIYEADPVIEQALEPDVAYELLQMMKGVVNYGTAQRLRGGRPYAGISYPTAGKTGTTQNNTDGWFIGLTPDLVTGVWVGAQDPTVRFSSTALGQGANTGLPIYGYYMNKVYKDPALHISKEDFKEPEGFDAKRFECKNGSSLFDEEDEEYEEDRLPAFDGESTFDADDSGTEKK